MEMSPPPPPAFQKMEIRNRGRSGTISCTCGFNRACTSDSGGANFPPICLRTDVPMRKSGLFSNPGYRMPFWLNLGFTPPKRRSSVVARNTLAPPMNIFCVRPLAVSMKCSTKTAYRPLWRHETHESLAFLATSSHLSSRHRVTFLATWSHSLSSRHEFLATSSQRRRRIGRFPRDTSPLSLGDPLGVRLTQNAPVSEVFLSANQIRAMSCELMHVAMAKSKMHR